MKTGRLAGVESGRIVLERKINLTATPSFRPPAAEARARWPESWQALSARLDGWS